MPTEEVIIEDDQIDHLNIKDIPYPIVIEFILYFIYALIISPKLSISFEVAIAIRILFVFLVIITLIIRLRRDYNKVYPVKSKQEKLNLSYLIFHSQYLVLISIIILQIYIFLLFRPVFLECHWPFICIYVYIYGIEKHNL